MKQFTMGMFANKEDLYKAKAEYWEDVARKTITSYYATTGHVATEEDIETYLELLEEKC